ncbi:hypothetical protein L3Y34_009505 [Caenorhabditis briggsae]|uniref:Uncharacterized protein n=1 Tax=Caenorhabditis briggsae TaxID=6238 RepID=A0AAE9AAB9_CAEBR|nr:hypothetical protein L3Y34_009505 [Caenorhabditis briggsae]
MSEEKRYMLSLDKPDGTNYVVHTFTNDGKLCIYSADELAMDSLKKWDPTNEIHVFAADLKKKKKGNGRNKHKGPKHDDKFKYKLMVKIMKKIFAKKEAYESTLGKSKKDGIINQGAQFLKDRIQSNKNHWIFPYLWLLILAPIYIPVICYFGAPIFDFIIRFFKDIFV